MKLSDFGLVKDTSSTFTRTQTEMRGTIEIHNFTPSRITTSPTRSTPSAGSSPTSLPAKNHSLPAPTASAASSASAPTKTQACGIRTYARSSATLSISHHRQRRASLTTFTGSPGTHGGNPAPGSDRRPATRQHRTLASPSHPPTPTPAELRTFTLHREPLGVHWQLESIT